MKSNIDNQSCDAIGAEANNTIEDVREDLDAHLDYLAKQYDVVRLTESQATDLAVSRLLRTLRFKKPDDLTMDDLRGVYFADSYSGVSRVTGRKMFFVDPDEHEDPLVRYFIGLHEIGHQALDHKNSIQSREQIIENEIAADEWALEHSIVEPNDEVLIMMQCALATYTDNYESGAWVEGATTATGNSLFPEADLPFNLKGEAIDNAITQEGEKRVRALAEREARKAQLTIDLQLAAKLQDTLDALNRGEECVYCGKDSWTCEHYEEPNLTD